MDSAEAVVLGEVFSSEFLVYSKQVGRCAIKKTAIPKMETAALFDLNTLYLNPKINGNKNVTITVHKV